MPSATAASRDPGEPDEGSQYARAESRAPGATTHAGAVARVAHEGARADRRAAGAVRAFRVHRPLVASRRLSARRSHARARAPPRRAGDAASLDDPHRLGSRLLAL